MRNICQIALLIAVLSPELSNASEEYKATCQIIEMKSLSPFYISRFGNKNSNQFGLEWNNWKDVHPSERNCSPINGYGLRILASPNGGTLSYYFNTSYRSIFGLSIGPEIGVFKSEPDLAISSRVWAPIFGMESRFSREEGITYGVYIYIPFHQAMIQ